MRLQPNDDLSESSSERDVLLPPPLIETDIVAKEMRRNYCEQRIMRGLIFLAVLGFAGIFLAFGLCIARQAATALIEHVGYSPWSPPLTNGSSKPLTTGALLTVIAFVLGVGLTLLLSLMRNVFSQPNSSETQPELSTPLSQLLIDLVAYLHKKLTS
ncbi:MAG: hypothetical protein ACRCYV_04075 [Aeromonas sp.]